LSIVAPATAHVSMKPPVTRNNAAVSHLVDKFSRTINYLRLSLTDRCNLRCLYCMPQEEIDRDDHVKTGRFLEHHELLSYEELLRVVRLTVALGMNKLRLTGGEPLVRKGILDFIQELFKIEGLTEVRLTTNGVLLEEYAARLYHAGVRQLNVSLDTLSAEKFARITGRSYFDKVWSGLLAAKEIGFKIKINVVAMRGINDDEFIDFANLALREPFQVRFIEFMPVGDKTTWDQKHFIGSDEIKARIETLGAITQFEKRHGDGPARMFELKTSRGEKGTVGFISPISHHFCDQCNRLRLTSEGKLRACLLNDRETDLKILLRGGATDDELIESIRHTIIDKPQGHTLDTMVERRSCSGRMSRIGG
jgi:GTP 3',8-cyclase